MDKEIKNGDKPALDINDDVQGSCHLGLTKREWLAGMAMQGILANFKRSGSIKNVVDYAVVAADEILKKLEEEPKERGGKSKPFGLQDL